MRQLQNIFAIAFLAVIFCQTTRAVPLIENELELETNNNSVELIGVDSIAELLKHDPSLQVDELTPAQSLGNSVVYTLGRRVRGDRLVGHADKAQSWSAPQNVKVTLTYPSSGVGARVSFVYIVVTQTTSLGKAYIIRGGVGQRFITIAVEGYHVAYLHYIANIFGY